MRTVRNSVFETNSSSAHCLVTAPNDQFAKFVNGELFAKQGGYKREFYTELVPIEDVYKEYVAYAEHENEFCREHDISNDETLVSIEFMKWWMLHPETIHKFDDGDEYLDDLPADMQDFAIDHIESLFTMNCWVGDVEYAHSFAMLDYYTNHFTVEYDDYRSQPPTEKDGNTSLVAVWYH